MNKKKYELERAIRNGEYGPSIQFFYSAEKEFRLVSDFSTYDTIMQKFESLKQELMSMMEQRRSSSPGYQPETKLNMLTEKFKTPFLDKRTYTAISKPAEISSAESNKSKKRTAEEADEQQDEKQTKSKKNKKVTKKKKKTKVKQKDDTFDLKTKEDNPAKKAKVDEKKKNKYESPSLTRLNKLVPKTPMTNRLSSRVLIHSSIKKTVKSKPLTRRAAAALAAAKSTAQDGHVKKMVNKIEQKILPTPQTQRKILAPLSIQKTINKYKTIRSSIDKRKSILSVSKLAAKRKSEKQVKAFLTNLKEDKLVLTDKDNNRISINAKDSHEKNLLSDMLNKSPQLVLSKMPTCLTEAESVSADIAGKIMENSEKRLSKELMMNSSVMSQYRPVILKTAVSASTIKATPSKHLFGSVGNLTSQNLYSKFTPSKLTRTEVDERKKAELVAKELKEKERLAELERQKQEKINEAKRKRDEKLKKVNEAKQKQKEDAEQKAKDLELKEKQRMENEKSKKTNVNSNLSIVLQKQSVMCSAQKKNVLNAVNLNTTKSTVVINKDNCSEFVNSFKKSLLMSQQFQTAQKLQKQKTVTLLKSDDKNNNLEQTYVLNSPSKLKQQNQSSYECTPLQPARLKDEDNYDVSDIRSDDDTDDEDEPSKPIPSWAKEPNLSQKAQDQCLKAINFTRLFRSACQADVNLEQIFKTRRRKFIERSSSANWNTPPIWSSNGITGEESFMQLRKNL